MNDHCRSIQFAGGTAASGPLCSDMAETIGKAPRKMSHIARAVPPL